jgi:radical SAM superfamily enzyme YgiQ (UPF0313 family)
MKVLLIYPYFLERRPYGDETVHPPIGIYYVGALLKENGYDTEILNWHDTGDLPDRMEAVLREKQPDVIGFSIFNGNRWGGIEIARIAKRMNPGVRIVFGGIGATFLWEHFLTHFQEIDFVVLGEGEYAFLNLVRFLASGEETGIDGLRGIAFRKKGKPVKTEDPEPIPDLDQLPDPARYFTFQHVALTRGCAWRCTFCGSPRFWGGKVRAHSPKYFADQVERLHGRGVRFFYFSDDTFTADQGRVIDVCRGIIDRGLDISWFAISRVEHAGEEMLSWMRRAGCIQISYGVESGSEKILAALNKKIRPGRVRQAFAATVRYGILARAYFIYGSPGETGETIRTTMDLIRAIKPLSAIFYILDIFPGTGLYDRLKQAGKVTDDIWLQRIEGILYCETDPDLPDELVLDFGRRLRGVFHENLPAFVEAIDLIDQKDLYPLHADFLSRLALTFSHGDYARIDGIRDREGIAESLFRKALSYGPDHRAFLGLGMLKQRQRALPESMDVLEQGLGYFPDSPDLNVCLGLNYMNQGAYEEALDRFLKFPESRDAVFHAASCYRAMGDFDKERQIMERYKTVADETHER